MLDIVLDDLLRMTEGKEHATSLDDLKDISSIAIGVRGLEVQVLLGGPHRDFACSSSGRAFDKQIGVLYFSSSCLCRWGVKPSVL